VTTWKNKNFEEWRQRNPGKSFKDFYAWTVERNLREGGSHRNLGSKISHGGFGKSGAVFFRKLIDLGLKPSQTLVDYGCGTLRVGVHAINYLEPGAYWGLDISDFLLKQGRELVGDNLWSQKRPHLHTISAESVAQAAAANPQMLISTKVLNHVHPDELDEYFHNVMQIIGACGLAIITGKWSEQETVQTKNRSWAPSLSLVQKLISHEGGRFTILEQEKKDGQSIRSGVLSLATRSARYK
jgi:hypothetical protein